jgi:hypothetical protein
VSRPQLVVAEAPELAGGVGDAETVARQVVGEARLAAQRVEDAGEPVQLVVLAAAEGVLRLQAGLGVGRRSDRRGCRWVPSARK